MKLSVALLAVVLSACGPSSTPKPPDIGTKASAGSSSSCSARNDAGKDCNVTCQSGQSAACRNGSGTNAPSCTCTPAK
jgi:hypothetical protein